MKKIVKPVLKWIFEMTFSNLHTTRFVIFTIQRPSDPQILMLTVRSHANADQGRISTYKFVVPGLSRR